MFESCAKGWIEDHPGLAAWIQAFGVFGSLWVVLYFSRRKEVRRREEELHRVKNVITHLKTILEPFRLKLAEVEVAPFKKKKIWLPNKLMQRSRDFHLLGQVGTNLGFLVEQLTSLNGSIAALPTEQPFDSEQRLQAEADIKEGLSSCHQLLESILEEMKEIELNANKEIELGAKKPSVVRRAIDGTQRLFGGTLGGSPSV